MFGGVGEDTAEEDFPGTTGGGQVNVTKLLLRFPVKRDPIRLFEVDKGLVGRFWEVHMEGTPQLQDYWEVVGV